MTVVLAVTTSDGAHSRFGGNPKNPRVRVFFVGFPPKLNTGRAVVGTARLRDSLGPKLRV
jgi:hypothetical protein